MTPDVSLAPQRFGDGRVSACSAPTPERLLLNVTDLKQYVYCPRIPFYFYCLPRIRPTTYSMEEGRLSHLETSEREERRTLAAYGLREGERFFDVLLRSERLGLVGKLDLAIRTHGPAGDEAVVVDYKLTRDPMGPHYRLQLAAYALLIEEAWGVPVRQAFVYHIPLRKAEKAQITAQLRRKVPEVVAEIQALVRDERMPEPPKSLARCVACEFRRFCNDTV